MLPYLLKRLAIGLVVIWGVATVTFFLVRKLPGDPFSDEKQLPPAIVANLKAHYGLDRSLGEQYLRFLGNLAQGDLGPSHKYKNWTVTEILASAFPVSATLGLAAIGLAVLAGMGLGVLAAARRGRPADAWIRTLAIVGLCAPTFATGPLFVLAFAFALGWLPPAGWGEARHLALPALTLALPFSAAVFRLTRASMLEAVSQDYVRTARAKGVREAAILYRHALRNALLPVVTYLGPATAGILTGSFVVERIFAIPGLGTHFVNAFLNRDWGLICGTTVVYASLLVFMNLLVDLSYPLIDPRLAHGRR